MTQELRRSHVIRRVSDRSSHRAPDGVTDRVFDRRAFVRFLAGSPLYGALAGVGCAPGNVSPPVGGAATQSWAVPASVDEVVNLLELEEAARRALPPAHFGYIATGVMDDATVRANRAGFDHYYLRPRRLVDVTEVDSSIDLFGTRWDTPIILAPAGSQRAFHPEGELAVARAARSEGHLQVLSTVRDDLG